MDTPTPHVTEGDERVVPAAQYANRIERRDLPVKPCPGLMRFAVGDREAS